MDAVNTLLTPQRRSAQASLGQVVLGFELIVVGLASLTIFGLGALPPALALGGGAAVCVLMLAAIGLMTKYKWAFILGWAVQLVIVLAGFAVTMLFLIGAIFAAIWTFAMTTGAKLDSQKKEN
ncbi:DUF4233 domain-containing protein [Aurantimicrobium minutum]|uniref:DUF4233 domain-containing protein n=1 Tax=Aurantimicrobium minutum TaxID=708131 RepID=UPI002473D6C6|nr:DUF4233 domain-containing protein [Aurantimicrobium minutum]MDH6422706.1 preprotein translocase subunit Sec61beta [Aurantimicrobium minutum]